MPAYFKPLRRKLGVVTLGLACVFMGIWIRSQYFYERSSPGSGRSSAMNDLRTFPAGLLFIRETPNPKAIRRREVVWNPVWLATASGPSKSNDPLSCINPHNGIAWRFQWGGFDFGELDRPYLRSPTLRWWLIPHRWIVIPLTLLSAWLLLSKPRAKKQPVLQPEKI